MSSILPQVRRCALCVAQSALLALLVATPAGAVVIVQAFEATVTSIDDPDGLLAGSGLTLGSLISGVYRFESTTTDVDADPQLGQYDGGMRDTDVVLGALVLAIDSAGSVNDRVAVTDDFLGADSYVAEINSLSATLGGAPIDFGFFGMSLQSSNLAILAGDSLPLAVPGSGPSDFDVENFIQVVGFSGASGFTVQATPTANTWTPAPEPSSFVLAALGLLALARRRTR